MTKTGFQVTNNILVEEKYKNFLSDVSKTYPLGRVGVCEDISEAVYFLSSESAKWITGASLVVDGGRSINI